MRYTAWGRVSNASDLCYIQAKFASKDYVVMRWVVFFLFIFNGLLLTWFVFEGDQRAQYQEKAAGESFDFSRVPTIQLLNELPEAQILGRDIRAERAVSSGSGAGGASCLLVGPFVDIISVRQARSELAERQLASRSVLVFKELPSVSWVYIAPQSDRKKALALLRELQAKNIDSFLIADGEFENGISLGFYTSHESAKEVMAERAKEGYSVSLVEKRREQKTYWLAFDEESSLRMENAFLEELDVNGLTLKKQEKSCHEVALLPGIE